MAPSRKLSLALALSLLASSATVNPALANPDESHVQANAHLVRDLPLHADVRHRRHHAALAARERAVAEKRDNILGGTLQGIGNVVSGLGSASNGPGE